MKFKFKRAQVTVAVALALGGMALPVFAGEAIEFGDGYKAEWRLTSTYTLSQRLKDADPLLARTAGSNDGDNNFKKGSLTANRLALLFEGKVSKGASGFVLSGSTFYDGAYHGSKDRKSVV